MANRNNRMKKKGDCWSWQCECGASNIVPLDCDAHELNGARIVCPACRHGYRIDKAQNIRSEISRKKFLITARIQRKNNGWENPSIEECTKLVTDITTVVANCGIAITDIIPKNDIRSIEIICSPAKALEIAEHKLICAVLPLDTRV